jgi:hypothetical protein
VGEVTRTGVPCECDAASTRHGRGADHPPGLAASSFPSSARVAGWKAYPALQPTAYSVHSCVAPAFGSG